MEQPIKAFDPGKHLIQLKSKQGEQDYLPVKWRLAWFRSVHPHGTIDTEEVLVDLDRVVEVEAYVWNAEKRRSEKVMKQAKGYARFRSIVTDGQGGRATGTKSENAATFPDFVEKSETGSIGRALAAMGFGTQFTDDEFSEGERIVDAPVERSDPSTERRDPAAKSSDVDALRTRWGNAYDIADDQFEERWGKYKIYLLGKNIADPDLTDFHRSRINGDLVKQERRTANKAS